MSTRKNTRVQSADQAHNLHESWRAWLLALARHHAVMHALIHGSVHTRNVREALCDEGILPVAGVGAGAAVERWLGSVFKKGPWAWTGQMHAVASSATNIHGGQSVRIWRLTSTRTEALDPWLERPAEPDGARERVLALYAPVARTEPAVVVPWPEGLDAAQVANELRLSLRKAALAGEREPVGFAELEAILRKHAASASNTQGVAVEHDVRKAGESR